MNYRVAYERRWLRPVRGEWRQEATAPSTLARAEAKLAEIQRKAKAMAADPEAVVEYRNVRIERATWSEVKR